MEGLLVVTLPLTGKLVASFPLRRAITNCHLKDPRSLLASRNGYLDCGFTGFGPPVSPITEADRG
jgi:hypothetical protein